MERTTRRIQAPSGEHDEPTDGEHVEQMPRLAGPAPTRPVGSGNGHAVSTNGSNGSAARVAPPAAGPRSPRSLTRTLAIVLTCAIDGALIAALLTVAGGSHYRAETLLEVRADPPVLQDDGPSRSPDEADRYLQTEILAIQSSFERGGLGREGSLAVQQVGVTDVLALQISAEDAATAVRLAGEVTDRYVADRTARSTQRIEEVTAEVQAQLADVSTQIDLLAAAPPEDQSANARRNALSAEYQRLVGTQHELDLARLEAAPISVISAADDTGAARTDRPWRSAAFGAVIGVVLSLAGILLWQRRPGAREREDARLEASHA
jgi:hypothetical protein